MSESKAPRTPFGAKTETLLGERRGDRALRKSDLNTGIAEQILRVLQVNLPGKASQAEAEAGADDTAYMTALKTKEQTDARIATEAEAEGGYNNTKLMTPLRTVETLYAYFSAVNNWYNLGWGQTWQNVTASRASATSYQNATGRPIMVALTCSAGSIQYLEVSADNATWVRVGNTQAANAPNSFIVPDGWYYRLVSGTFLFWSELR